MTPPQEIDMIEMLERLTRLETEHKALEHQHQSIQKKLDMLITRFDKYEAKWGGVLMVVSAVGAVVIAFKSELIKWLAGK
jgi:hypothetical protein